MRAPLLAAVLVLCLPKGADALETGTSWGGVGMVEMRSARMRPDGTLEVGVSNRLQRRNWFVNFQAFPWLEATFRFTERLNATTGRGITTDRSFDVKIRLAEETRFTPAVAIGLQDFLGTGIYGGEYVVASKRFGPLDVSLGTGWGRLGTEADLTNPFCRLADRLCIRETNIGQGGVPRFGSYFRGRDVALFGGVAWTTPMPALTAIVEVSGDALRDERRRGLGRSEARVNAGLVWRPLDGLEVSAGFVHGKDVVLRASLIADPADPPRVLPAPPLPPPPRPDLAPDWKSALIARLRADGMPPMRLGVVGAELHLGLAASRHRTLAAAAGRAARLAAETAPEGIEWVVVSLAPGGTEIARIALLRGEVARAATGLSSAEEIAATATLSPARPLPEPPSDEVVAAFPRLSWVLEPRVVLALMDPSDPLSGELMAVGGGRIAFGHGLSLGGEVGADLIGNLRGRPRPPDTKLAPVRTEIGSYLEATRFPLLSLTAEGIWTVAPDLFARVTAGLLEMMYGGVQGEILWRPVDSRFAIGADLAWVRQRGFDQSFRFRDYETVTGHVSLYVDLPYRDLYAVLRAGRYLARDWGATLELGRRFDNGVEIGGFATLTDAGFDKFGEGSFDKGIYVRFPFDVFGGATPSRGQVLIRPLIRDGGQRLAVDNPLYEFTREGRREAFLRGLGGLVPGR
ncbi:MAG: YjbH domain-containing protein [Acetobacteraceae bacterium]|nr:YjbH domain-containing protein [Acetobacteraceae bacterium]